MVLLATGKIRCDAAGCAEEIRIPSGLPGAKKEGEGAAKGWLFVVTEIGREHYCPNCATRYLVCTHRIDLLPLIQ